MKVFRNVVFVALAVGFMAAQPQVVSAAALADCVPMPTIYISDDEGGCPAMWDYIVGWTQAGESCDDYCGDPYIISCLGASACWAQDWDCEPFPGPSAEWFCDCLCMY